MVIFILIQENFLNSKQYQFPYWAAVSELPPRKLVLLSGRQFFPYFKKDFRYEQNKNEIITVFQQSCMKTRANYSDYWLEFKYAATLNSLLFPLCKMEFIADDFFSFAVKKDDFMQKFYCSVCKKKKLF